ncbi:MAG: 50S ribosomal protein L6 [Candidatus Berkelbacteria bacterium]|nr:MAG: 50S ribosomal protein L6 [Candidatus Berkelbacteria bacterium]QQG52107.1 MAG: 50S ribosomal protein L6 [Candidatus Berkelbacteria bacterium]
MSRVGIRPIPVTEGVNVELTPTKLTARGSLGVLEVNLPHGVIVTQKENQILVNRISDAKPHKALHGTIRNLIRNAIVGVSAGFEKRLELVGIGYRAAIEGPELVLQVGFTHSVKMPVPEGLQVKIEKNIISISGADKQKLGQFCAEIRAVRPPEPYKGKGIRYQGEQVRMKQGKAVKAGA